MLRKTYFPFVVDRNLLDKHSSAGIAGEKCAGIMHWSVQNCKCIAPSRDAEVRGCKTGLHDWSEWLQSVSESEVIAADKSFERGVAPPFRVVTVFIANAIFKLPCIIWKTDVVDDIVSSIAVHKSGCWRRARDRTATSKEYRQCDCKKRTYPMI